MHTGFRLLHVTASKISPTCSRQTDIVMATGWTSLALLTELVPHKGDPGMHDMCHLIGQQL